jgi:hypothetical protein
LAINIDQLSVTSLKLECVCNGVPYSSGTGFIIKTETKYFLASNYHILSGYNPETGKPISNNGAVTDKIKIMPIRLIGTTTTSSGRAN